MKIRKEICFDRTRYINENGDLHREDGPAIEWNNGGKSWWHEGKLHRLDGPAVERYNGVKAWVINGKNIPVKSQADFERYLKLVAFQ